MEIVGKVVKTLPVVTGESARGAWKKQEVIIETSEQYPKKVCISCWGNMVDELQNLSLGQDVRMSINIESREYNERWYTDVRAWKIDSSGMASTPPPPATNAAPVEMAPDTTSASDDNDDLPF